MYLRQTLFSCFVYNFSEHVGKIKKFIVNF